MKDFYQWACAGEMPDGKAEKDIINADDCEGLLDNGWFDNEYYIKVHLKNEPRLHFYIMNSTPVMNTVWEWDLEKGVKRAHEKRYPPLAFKGHGEYLEYIWDAESCAEFGY